MKKILIIDDDQNVIEFLEEEIKKRLKDVVIVSCNTGYKALNILFSGTVDLMISDIAIPDLDGYQLYLRAKDINEDMPVIMMTGFGYDPGHVIVNVRKSGLEDILYKPFDTDKLISLIKTKLDIP